MHGDPREGAPYPFVLGASKDLRAANSRKTPATTNAADLLVGGHAAGLFEPAQLFEDRLDLVDLRLVAWKGRGSRLSHGPAQRSQKRLAPPVAARYSTCLGHPGR